MGYQTVTSRDPKGAVRQYGRGYPIDSLASCLSVTHQSTHQHFKRKSLSVIASMQTEQMYF